MDERSVLCDKRGGLAGRERSYGRNREGYTAVNFCLPRICTGFLRLEIEAEEQTEIFAVMEEYLEEGKWQFRRSNCNDFLYVRVPVGKQNFLSAEPYAFKYLKILYKGKVRIAPRLVALQNDEADYVQAQGDEKLVAIFEAAKRTFCQNAVDIFTDCPGRERAGWLCDSYFTGQAERLFTGENRIEKAFWKIFCAPKQRSCRTGCCPCVFPRNIGCIFPTGQCGLWRNFALIFAYGRFRSDRTRS